MSSIPAADELSAPADFLSRMRHTTAHVLAQAVRERFPEAKMGVGPVIENGFSTTSTFLGRSTTPTSRLLKPA